MNEMQRPTWWKSAVACLCHPALPFVANVALLFKGSHFVWSLGLDDNHEFKVICACIQSALLIYWLVNGNMRWWPRLAIFAATVAIIVSFAYAPHRFDPEFIRQYPTFDDPIFQVLNFYQTSGGFALAIMPWQLLVICGYSAFERRQGRTTGAFRVGDESPRRAPFWRLYLTDWFLGSTLLGLVLVTHRVLQVDYYQVALLVPVWFQVQFQFEPLIIVSIVCDAVWTSGLVIYCSKVVARDGNKLRWVCLGLVVFVVIRMAYEVVNGRFLAVTFGFNFQVVVESTLVITPIISAFQYALAMLTFWWIRQSRLATAAKLNAQVA